MGDGPHLHALTTPRPSRRSAALRIRGIVSAGALLGLLTAGACSNSRGSDEAQTADGAATAETGAFDGEMPGDAATGEAAVVDPASVKAATAAEGRDQAFTATLDIKVEVLEDSVNETSTAVEAIGGFVANEQVDLGERQHATVTYRVPADQFRQALDAITAVGDLQTQQVEGQDVTAQYADLESRVTTLRTSITRLQGFLAEATDANQMASLEGELTRREAELESTEAQRRALADRIELSTITVSFTGSEAVAPVDDTRTLPTFLGGMETGWDILVGVGAFALSALGFLAPFLPLALVAVLLMRWARRRRQPAVS